MRRRGPDHREAQVQNQCYRSLILFCCAKNLSMSTNISHTVCWAPPLLPSVASQSTRYFICHFATSGALKAFYQRINVGMSAIGLSLVTFFGIKKNIVRCACLLRPFSTLFHLLQEFHNCPSRSFCQVQWNLWMEAITSCSCLCFVHSR